MKTELVWTANQKVLRLNYSIQIIFNKMILDTLSEEKVICFSKMQLYTIWQQRLRPFEIRTLIFKLKS